MSIKEEDAAKYYKKMEDKLQGRVNATVEDIIRNPAKEGEPKGTENKENE